MQSKHTLKLMIMRRTLLTPFFSKSSLINSTPFYSHSHTFQICTLVNTTQQHRYFSSNPRDAQAREELQKLFALLREKSNENDNDNNEQQGSDSKRAEQQDRVDDIKNKKSEVRVGGIRGDGKSPKFYENVFIQKEEKGYSVRVDGRCIQTPKNRDMIVPTSSLALLIAAEWDSQNRHILPSTLPLTKLAVGALDLMPEGGSDEVRKSLILSLGTDQTCHRDDSPLLSRHQTQNFTPLIRWFEENFGKLTISKHFGFINHPPETLEKVKQFLASLNDWEIIALEPVALVSKSLVITLAIFKNFLPFEEAERLIRLEEDYQANLWGEVEGGHDVDKADNAVKLTTSMVLLDAIRIGEIKQ